MSAPDDSAFDEEPLPEFESPVSLGGQNAEVDYHPLAVDKNETGFWGVIDRLGDRVSGWLNPILIKEARQSLKSRQFSITFFLLLTCSCLWTILGVVWNSPDVFFVPTGVSLLTGYYLILAIPLIGMVPLVAHRSLASEIENDTFEMLSITKLSSARIVVGKLNSAMLQMLVYFAAIVPCIAFSYLLRGITLPMIFYVVLITFFTALLITSFGLLLATLAFNRTGQTLAMLFLLFVIFVAEITCFQACTFGVLNNFSGDGEDILLGVSIYIIIGISCIALFIKAAAARIAPVSENRSTGLRWTMFVQQLVWLTCMCLLSIWYDDDEGLIVGCAIAFFYWYLMGTLMLSESAELSPRVQRDLPSTFAGRVMLTWFNPGPATGYVFAVSTGLAGIVAFAIFGINESYRSGTIVNFALVTSGYLMAYLGITRLIAMPIQRRCGNNIAITLAVAIFVLLISAITPLVILVCLTGSPAYDYTPLEAINWFWTLDEASSSRFSPFLAAIVFFTGLAITIVNLIFLFRVFQYRKVSVPKRVLQDEMASAT